MHELTRLRYVPWELVSSRTPYYVRLPFPWPQTISARERQEDWITNELANLWQNGSGGSAYLTAGERIGGFILAEGNYLKSSLANYKEVLFYKHRVTAGRFVLSLSFRKPRQLDIRQNPVREVSTSRIQCSISNISYPVKLMLKTTCRE